MIDPFIFVSRSSYISSASINQRLAKVLEYCVTPIMSFTFFFCYSVYISLKDKSLTIIRSYFRIIQWKICIIIWLYIQSASCNTNFNDI